LLRSFTQLNLKRRYTMTGNQLLEVIDNLDAQVLSLKKIVSIQEDIIENRNEVLDLLKTQRDQLKDQIEMYKIFVDTVEKVTQ